MSGPYREQGRKEEPTHFNNILEAILALPTEEWEWVGDIDVNRGSRHGIAHLETSIGVAKWMGGVTVGVTGKRHTGRWYWFRTNKVRRLVDLVKHGEHTHSPRSPIGRVEDYLKRNK